MKDIEETEEKDETEEKEETEEKDENKSIKEKETQIINSLLHLTYMNDMVYQINKYKLDIIKDIYKTYFSNSNLTYEKFKKSIFKNKRPDFIKKDNKKKSNL